MALFSTIPATQNFNKINKSKADPLNKEYENFEYRSFKEYRAAGGVSKTLKEWDGKDAKWLEVDRIHCRPRWIEAVKAIINNNSPDRLMPFGQVADFYRYTKLLVSLKKHQSRWLYGAYYLVSDLANLFDKSLSLEMTIFIHPLAPLFENPLVDIKNFEKLLIRLNRAIANYAIKRFHNLLNGSYSKVPLIGLTAWKFDKQFVIEEQGDIAKSTYEDQSLQLSKAIENLVFNYGGAFIRYLTINKLNLPDFGYIPVFQDQYNSDLTVDTNENPLYGQEARIEVPLAMLYPNELFYNDDAKLDTIQANAINLNLSFKDSKFGKTLKRGKEKKGHAKYDEDIEIYMDYTLANSLIKKRFNKINGKR